MRKETWKDIAGYEGKYEVSSYGRIKSLPRYRKTSNGMGYVTKEKILVLHLQPNGYCQVGLSKEGKQERLLVHRIVCCAFFGVPSTGKSWANHKNGIKDDNRVCNLEWCSPKENLAHAIKYLGKSPAPRLGIGVKVLRINPETRESVVFNTMSDAARSVCGSVGNIWCCCNNIRVLHRKYKWKIIKGDR
jgi:hypothetical protein